MIHGAQEKARRQLQELQNQYSFDELVAVTAVDDFTQRMRSFELLGQLIDPMPA